jgi:hypothetical protein
MVARQSSMIESTFANPRRSVRSVLFNAAFVPFLRYYSSLGSPSSLVTMRRCSGEVPRISLRGPIPFMRCESAPRTLRTREFRTSGPRRWVGRYAGTVSVLPPRRRGLVAAGGQEQPHLGWVRHWLRRPLGGSSGRDVGVQRGRTCPIRTDQPVRYCLAMDNDLRRRASRGFDHLLRPPARVRAIR